MPLKKRINRLYKRAPKDTVVVCFDGLGAVQIKPHAGSSWAPRKHPVRHRATYTRRGGASYFFEAYNVHENTLWMHHKPKKHASVVLDFLLKAIRCRYPKAQRIYVVMNNLSTHKTPTILQWCRRNQVSPVFTATNASWMNRLECHLTAAHYFVIKNSDPDDHREVGQCMQEYLRWRNKNTQNAKLTKVQNSMPTL